MQSNVNFLRMGVFGAAATAVLAATLPVSAALWPATPAPVTGAINLALYDAVPRVGDAQLPTDPFCDSPDIVAISLTEDYAEEITLSAMNDDGTRFDFWASGQSGTWTVTYTRADGIACVVGSGTGWSDGAAPADFLQRAGVAL
jgi:hypothetical protein